MSFLYLVPNFLPPYCLRFTRLHSTKDSQLTYLQISYFQDRNPTHKPGCW